MRYIKRILIGVILATTLGYSINLNLKVEDVDIKDFIKTVGQLIGKNILVDGDVRGKVTFYMNNGKDLRKEDLIPLLNAILETKKMTLINQGGYYEVVKSTEASGKGLPVRHNRVSQMKEPCKRSYLD